MKKLFIGVVVILTAGLLVSNLYGQGAFESLGSGARAIGMGNAFTGVADDANALAYNPAGLGTIWGWQGSAMGGVLHPGLYTGQIISDAYGSFVYPLEGIATFGLSVHDYSVGGDYGEDTFILGLGRELMEGFSIGLNAKGLLRRVGEDYQDVLNISGTKFAPSLDVGLMYTIFEVGAGDLSIGVCAQDVIQPKINFTEETETVPLAARVGLGYMTESLTGAADVAYRDGNIKAHLGLETWLMEGALGLRGGAQVAIGDNTSITPCAGLSYRLLEMSPNIQLDYAFIYPVGGVAGTFGSHRVSVSVLMGDYKNNFTTKARNLESIIFLFFYLQRFFFVISRFRG